MSAVVIETGAVHGGARSPSKWLPLAVASVVAAFLAAFGYYGLKYFRDSTFNDERAFRVLAEMVGQFGNFQNAMDGLFRLIPADAIKKPEEGARFKAQLSLPPVGLSASCTPSVTTPPPADNPRLLQLFIHTDMASHDFRACGLAKVHPQMVPNAPEGSNDPKDLEPIQVTLAGSLQEHLQTFMGQEFFDLVVIALADGTAVADIPLRRNQEFRLRLHEANAQTLVVGNTRALLLHAAKQEAGEKLGASKDDKSWSGFGVPAHPVVFTDTLAGETYRVFVQPFKTDYPVATPPGEASPGTTRAPEKFLYLVGLKRQDLFGSIDASLGSAGMLTMTLLAVLAVLGWPMLSLRFTTQREAISRTQVAAILLALSFIPVVLTVVGFSIWSVNRLVVWADKSAEKYGAAVEQLLLEELMSDVRVLSDMAPKFAQQEGWLNRAGLEDFTASACEPAAEDQCKHPLAGRVEKERIKGWSRFRTIVPLNADGRSSGVSLDTLNGRAMLPSLDLSDRPYFKAIRAGEQWRPTDLWCNPRDTPCLVASSNGFVAQRLFNRLDADRTLQIAVPMNYKSNGLSRTGILTGTSRAYALTKAVRPPLLRFAVIDSSNGVVLFHSDDRHSLAENFLIETENNEALERLMRKRAAEYTRGFVTLEDHFSGRYLGESHRFYYRPVAGIPWGVISYYAVDDLYAIVLQTAVATLATSLGVIVPLALLLGILIVVLPERADRWLLALLWPRWERRELYAAFFVIGAVVLLVAIVLMVAKLHAANVVSLAAVGVGAIAVQRLRTKSVIHRSVTLEAYQRYYVACMAIALFGFCVLPTTLLAIDFHDTSVKAFIRDGLQQSAADVEDRHDNLVRDLQRFRDTNNVKRARELSEELLVPGFWVERSGEVSRWVLSDAAAGLWLRRCGPPILDIIRSTIWAMSTARHAQRPLVATSSTDQGTGGGADGEECADAKHVVAYWRRGEDGYRMKMAMPLRANTRPPTALHPLMPDRHLRIQEDLQTHYTYSRVLWLGFVVAFLLLFMVLLCWHVARRLFGIRIPFAGRFVGDEGKSFDRGSLVDAEVKLVALRKQHAAHFTSKDEKDWRAVNCAPVYAQMWQQLSLDERLLMHQIATGAFANPENRAVLEPLLRRGYLSLWPWPRIVEEGFVRYICSLPTGEQLAQLQRESTQGLWGRIRTPLLILVVVTAGLLMWLAGSSMQILSAALAGTAALFSSISQVTGFVRKEGKD